MFAPERRRRFDSDDFVGTALRAEWARTDTENKLAVGGGVLSVGPRAVPVWDDPRATRKTTYTARAGLILETEITVSSFGATGCAFGFDTSNPVVASLQPGFRIGSAGQVSAVNFVGTITATPLTIALATSYRFRVRLLGAAGVAWSYSDDGGKTWKLLWIDATATGALYAGYSNNSATFTSDYLRVGRLQALAPVLSDAFAARTAPGRADTGQPWLIQSGTSAPAFASNDMRIPAGQTASLIFAPTGIADGIWEADLNFGGAPSTTKQASIYLRYRDANNYVRAVFDRVAQTITVRRAVGAVLSTLATLSAAGFADNTTYRMRVVAVGSSIWVYQDGAFKLSVSEPAFQYVAMFSLSLNDNLAAPDIRFDNVAVWGTPRRPLLMDSFDRPNAVYSAPTPDVGPVYVMSTDVGMPAGSVVSEIVASGRGQLSPNGPLSAAAYLYGLYPLPLGSFLASVVVRWDSLTGNLGSQGMMLRRQDDQNYLAVYLNSINNSVVVRKRLAGTFTTIASGSFTPVAGVDALLSVQVTGNTVEVYVNAVRLVSTSYSDFQAPGMAGPFQGIFGLSVMHEDDLRIYALTSPVAQHDTFTRADSATTLGSTETPGTAWVTYGQGAGSSVWGITSNKAYQVSVAGGALFGVAGVQTGFSDVDSSVLIAGIAAGTVQGLAFRIRDKDNLFSARIEGSPQSDIIVRKTVAGVSSTIATYSPGAGVIADGSSHTLRVRALGNAIFVYLDGALVLSTSDSDLAGEKIHGLMAASGTVGTSRTFDNYEAKEVA